MTFLSGLENAPKIIIFVEVQKRFRDCAPWKCGEGSKLRDCQQTVALETRKYQLYDVFWYVRDAKTQLYDVFSKVRETNIQLFDVFWETGDPKYSFYIVFLKAREVKSSF